MAYLDIWDMISDRGFWDGGASGDEVNGMLGFMDPGWLMGVEFVLRGGNEGPVSVELFPPLPTPLIPAGPTGLGCAVFGDAAQPGEAMGMAGDLRRPGEAEGLCSPRDGAPMT